MGFIDELKRLARPYEDEEDEEEFEDFEPVSRSERMDRTRPVSGSSKVPIICSSVVLPAPLGPTMLTTSLLLISRSMPFSTCNEPKFFVIPSNFIIIAFIIF